MALPPEPSCARDRDHLEILSIFYFVLAGLGTVGLAFLMMHYFFMSTFFSHPSLWDQMKDKNGNPVSMPFTPYEFMEIFRWFYLLVGGWGVASIIINLAAGFALRQEQSRTFLLLAAGFNCLNIPFGTVLGIFSILVLMRDSVRIRFESHREVAGQTASPVVP